jgi:histidyl-tRNA synthetase
LGEKKQWSYFGPIFRHEKPQKARFREFFQFGVESISSSFTSSSDAEVLILAHDILKALKIDFQLQINTLGDEISRKKFNLLLEKYFQGKKLSKNSENRAEKGKFLRILDSKEPEDQENLKNCPSILECLDSESLKYFEDLQQVLKEAEVDFEYNPKLVRGLDYYSNVCFEFLKNGQALLGGGRYDNLAGMVDKSKNLGGIGWAAGVDRIADYFSLENQAKIIGIVPIAEENSKISLKIARNLRKNTDFQVKLKTEAKNIKQHMNYLKNFQTHCIIFIGEEEMEKGLVKIKKDGKHFLVDLNELMQDPGKVLNRND